MRRLWFIAAGVGLAIATSASIPIWPGWQIGVGEFLGYRATLWTAIADARAAGLLEWNDWRPGLFTLGLLAVIGLGLGCGADACLRAHQKRQRMRAGLCLSCGYDLRATAGSCPECGRKVEKRTHICGRMGS